MPAASAAVRACRSGCPEPGSRYRAGCSIATARCTFRCATCRTWHHGSGASRAREAFYPALFEELNYPYTGSDAYVLTVTLDKWRPLAVRAGVPELIVQDGYAFAYESEAGFAADALGREIRRRRGVAIDVLTGAAIREFDPALAVFKPDDLLGLGFGEG